MWEWVPDWKKNWRHNREELGVCKIGKEWREKREQDSRSKEMGGFKHPALALGLICLSLVRDWTKKYCRVTVAVSSFIMEGYGARKQC